MCIRDSSGDATLVFPAQKIYFATARRIKKISRQIAKEDVYKRQGYTYDAGADYVKGTQMDDGYYKQRFDYMNRCV